MNELSLFSGAGLGLLGTHILGWTPVGYVEIDEYCQRVLRARIDDGYLPEAPIFGDIRRFIQSGAAREYRGFADVVTAGFPCTPFSAAGKRLGGDDPRNMWPETADCIRLVRPGNVLLENSPRLLASGYFGRILSDLAALGYHARWDCIPASALGAPHQRDRSWIVATHRGVPDTERDDLRIERERGGRKRGEPGPAEPREHGQAVSLADSDCSELRLESGRRVRQGRQVVPELEAIGWWTAEPWVGRVADGVPARMDRLRALGNGQIPRVVQVAWNLLSGRNA